MSRRYFDDRTNRQIPTEECTTLRVSGPLRAMTGRPELHLDKPGALALARWLGFELARPEVETIDGPEIPDAHRPDADGDPFAFRVDAISRGTPAGTTAPPKGRNGTH